MSAGREAQRRVWWGTQALNADVRRVGRASRRRDGVARSLISRRGGNGWYGRVRSTARCGTRASCSSLIRGARRDPCDVALGRRRDLESVLATVIHLRHENESVANRTNIETGLVYLRVQRHIRHAREETGPAMCAFCLRFVCRVSIGCDVNPRGANLPTSARFITAPWRGARRRRRPARARGSHQPRRRVYARRRCPCS